MAKEREFIPDTISEAHQRANEVIGESLVDKTLNELKDEEKVFKKPHWELESLLTQQRLRRLKR